MSHAARARAGARLIRYSPATEREELRSLANQIRRQAPSIDDRTATQVMLDEAERVSGRGQAVNAGTPAGRGVAMLNTTKVGAVGVVGGASAGLGVDLLQGIARFF